MQQIDTAMTPHARNSQPIHICFLCIRTVCVFTCQLICLLLIFILETYPKPSLSVGNEKKNTAPCLQMKQVSLLPKI